MKKILCLFLSFLLMSPVFASWLPHGVAHALHENNIKHLLESSHQHSPHHHDHDHDHDHDDSIATVSESHHPIHIDIVSFYDDYINADLQRSDLNNVDIPAFDFYHFSLEIKAYSDVASLHEKNHPPLDWGIFSSSTTPLYLSTQRLRI